ncbi:MAG TPA: alpha/beta hydrolase-fold protein [Ignavibacteriales bacterium]|nr:alpha/beta hydrolase-fold protein [Ignavibacteriales bacterium]
MNVEYHKFYSNFLSQDMELKVYGHSGKPVLVFPCHGGRFYEWEDFKMFDVLYPFTENGQYIFFTVDSIDGEPWSNENYDIPYRAYKHQLYENYLINEVVPFIKNKTQKNKILATGMSMGGYHASSIALRYPEIFDQLICLSGVLKLNIYIGDYYDENVEKFSPIHFVRTLINDEHLNKLRQNRLIFCTGQGQWEEETIEDYKEINFYLFEKRIPAWIDFWGFDVSHDWPWWKIQLPYYLNILLNL